MFGCIAAAALLLWPKSHRAFICPCVACGCCVGAVQTAKAVDRFIIRVVPQSSPDIMPKSFYGLRAWTNAELQSHVADKLRNEGFAEFVAGCSVRSRPMVWRGWGRRMVLTGTNAWAGMSPPCRSFRALFQLASARIWRHIEPTRIIVVEVCRCGRCSGGVAGAAVGQSASSLSRLQNACACEGG